MPNVTNTVTYTAVGNCTTPNCPPTSPINWSNWSITPGVAGVAGDNYQIISGGNNADSFIQVKWLQTGNYTISVLGNNCGSPVTGSILVKVTCNPGTTDANPLDIRCGGDSEVNLDPCNKYKKKIDNCTGAVTWAFESNDATCAGCNPCSPDWQYVNGSDSCGANIATHPTHPQSGLDVCTVYIREEDGCGNSRWTADGFGESCPGCVTACTPVAIVNLVNVPATITAGPSYTVSTNVLNLRPTDLVRITVAPNVNAPAFVQAIGANVSITFTVIPDPLQNNSFTQITATVIRNNCPNEVGAVVVPIVY